MRVRLLAGAAGVLLLAGCADAADNGPSAPQSAGTTEAATETGGVAHLTVDAGEDLRFSQTHLTAPAGKIQITLVVTGQTEHDLTFTDGPQGGTSEISAAQSSVTLTFSTPGTYHFLCTVHPRMQGTLTVS